MKKLLFLLITSFLLFGCKKDKAEPIAADPAIATIVDKWQMVAYERIVNGEKVWENVSGGPGYLSVRFDGVILDSKDLPVCCSPSEYILNGTLFKIVPKAEVPANPSCAFVDCIGCDSWIIEQTENEMIIDLPCTDFLHRAKYVRV